jgi:deoxycytidine triphosphate deaminase
VNVIDEARFVVLRDSGEINEFDCTFLDGIKIGLRIGDQLWQPQTDVEVHSGEHSQWRSRSPDSVLLEPGQFFLAVTRERISISNRIFGQLHTRSKWARLGLDCIGSSHYVSPGFGDGTPTSLVLEVVPRLSICLPRSDAIAALILFELDHPVRTACNNHASQFPLNCPSF